ncbi:hypothetical protein ACB286_00215 [Enterobacter cloacae]
MKRENRYFVLKVADIDAAYKAGFISPETLDALEHVALAVKHIRQQRGKDELSCVVVESDWPEHEIVWGMIESRMEGMQS